MISGDASDGNSGVQMVCNAVSNSSYGVTFQNLGANPPAVAKVLHNAFEGVTADLSNSPSFPVLPAPAVGSNWYGSDPLVQGSLLVAQGLALSPVADPLCGDNSVVGFVAVDGTPQSAVIGNAFTTPLQVRAVDVFGGSVAGQAVQFTAPATGASASLGRASKMPSSLIFSVMNAPPVLR